MAYVFGNQYGVVTVRDAATLHEPKEIRFITPEYKDLFKIPDGGQILLCYQDGTVVARTCRYLDDYHLLVGMAVWHICEFAERMKATKISVVPFPEKHIIWSNRNLNLRDWIQELAECNPGLDMDQYESMMYEINDDHLADERLNLDIQVGDEIIAIADLGLWNGRRMGYKIIESGKISDCLYATADCEYHEWYVDRNGEFCSTQTHHDGTHTITFRKWKDHVCVDDRMDLKEKIYHGSAAQEDIDALTEKLGERVGQVYGWEFPTKQNERESVRDSR